MLDFRHSKFLGIADKDADAAPIALDPHVRLTNKPGHPLTDAPAFAVHLISYLGVSDHGAARNDSLVALASLTHDAPLKKHPGST